MTVQYFDFEDKPIKTACYKLPPEREFRKEEKYYKVGNKKTGNPEFDLAYAKELKNSQTVSDRIKFYPPLTVLADAIYWEKNGDSSKMDKYISDCSKVKKDHPLI